VLKKWYTSYKDHIKLSDYEIHNGMSLELYYVCCLLAAWVLTGCRVEGWSVDWREGSCMHFSRSLGFSVGLCWTDVVSISRIENVFEVLHSFFSSAFCEIRE
jgi:hypothetical protein